MAFAEFKEDGAVVVLTTWPERTRCAPYAVIDGRAFVPEGGSGVKVCKACGKPNAYADGLFMPEACKWCGAVL